MAETQLKTNPELGLTDAFRFSFDNFGKDMGRFGLNLKDYAGFDGRFGVQNTFNQNLTPNMASNITTLNDFNAPMDVSFGETVSPTISAGTDPNSFGLWDSTQALKENAMSNSANNIGNGVKGAQTGLGLNVGTVTAGLGVLSALLDNKNQEKVFGLQEKALKDQLKNSRMQRDLAYDDLALKSNVRASLGGALGADTSYYKDTLKKYGKYTSEKAGETA